MLIMMVVPSQCARRYSVTACRPILFAASRCASAIIGARASNGEDCSATQPRTASGGNHAQRLPQRADPDRGDRRAGGHQRQAVADPERVALIERVPRDDRGASQREDQEQRRPAARHALRQSDQRRRRRTPARPRPCPRADRRCRAPARARADALTERFVLRNEEPCRNEPGARRPAAVGAEEHQRDGRIDRHPQAPAQRLADGDALAQQREEREPQQRRADRPGLVPGHAGGDNRPAGGARRRSRRGVRPTPPCRGRPAWTCRSASARSWACSAGRAGWGSPSAGTRRRAPASTDPVIRCREPRQRPGRNRHARNRQRDRRGAGSIPRIDLNRQHVEHVRKRQPHRADLLPARAAGCRGCAARRRGARGRRSAPAPGRAGCNRPPPRRRTATTRGGHEQAVPSDGGETSARGASGGDSADGAGVVGRTRSSLHSTECVVCWPGSRDSRNRWEGRVSSSSRSWIRRSSHFPRSSDALIVLLTVQHPERMVFYALTTTDRLGRGLLCPLHRRPQGRGGLPPQALSRAPHRPRDGDVPAARHAVGPGAVAASSADAVQDLRPGGRRSGMSHVDFLIAVAIGRVDPLLWRRPAGVMERAGGDRLAARQRRHRRDRARCGHSRVCRRVGLAAKASGLGAGIVAAHRDGRSPSPEPKALDPGPPDPGPRTRTRTPDPGPRDIAV